MFLRSMSLHGTGKTRSLTPGFGVCERVLLGALRECWQKAKKALERGFQPLLSQLVQLPEVELFDEEQWSALLWDVLEAATDRTQSAMRFPELRQDGDAWGELADTLLETGRERLHSRVVKPGLVALVLYGVAGIVLLSLWQVAMSGRAQLWSVASAMLCVGIAELWRRCGREVEMGGAEPFSGTEKALRPETMLDSTVIAPGGALISSSGAVPDVAQQPKTEIEASGAAASDAGEVYAPLAGQKRMAEQARRVKDLLVLWQGRSALLPVWAQSFWQEVGLLEPLEQRLKSLLLSQGYLGRGAGVPPRFKELKEKLEELGTAGAVAHSLDAFKAQEGFAWQDDSGDPEGWEAALPPDLKRAGPEIYASMKASGVRCVRDWVNSMFAVEQRTSATYVDLFNLASLVDFKAKEGGQSQARVLSIIAQDHTCEVALRRLAAWIHEKRTGDRDAAQSMLAIKPSSFATDVAPTWLVSEAATYSQSEHKRRERARAQTHGGSSANASWSKGGGKGGKDRKGGKDKKKGSGGKGAAAASTQG